VKSYFAQPIWLVLLELCPEGSTGKEEKNKHPHLGVLMQQINNVTQGFRT